MKDVSSAGQASFDIPSGEGGSDDPDLEAAKAATPSPIPAAPPVLRPGAKGDGVIALQRSLNDWRSIYGAALVSTDGAYGPSTVTAVKKLQKAKGMTQDGVVGPGTWKALAEDISPIVAPATGGFSPAGSYALSGDDPARGSFTGQVAISALRDPQHVRVRYSAVYAAGSEGTISGIGRLSSHYLSLYIPIEKGGGTGVFSREASPSRDAAFHLDYDFDPQIGSATGATYIAVAGRPVDCRTRRRSARRSPARPTRRCRRGSSRSRRASTGARCAGRAR